MTRGLLSVMFVLATAAAAGAGQAGPSVGEVQDRLKVGRKIYVTEQDGREVAGRFAELTPAALVVVQDGVRRDIPLAAVRRIEIPDPLWTGVLIGAGIGGAMALTIRTDRVQNAIPDPAHLLLDGGLGLMGRGCGRTVAPRASPEAVGNERR